MISIVQEESVSMLQIDSIWLTILSSSLPVAFGGAPRLSRKARHWGNTSCRVASTACEARLCRIPAKFCNHFRQRGVECLSQLLQATHDNQHPVRLHRHGQIPPELLREQLSGNTAPGEAIVYDIIRLITGTQETTCRPYGSCSGLDRSGAIVQDESGRVPQAKVMVSGMIDGRVDLCMG